MLAVIFSIASNFFDGITAFFVKLLSAFPVDPSYYYILFPTQVSLEDVRNLIKIGVFPTTVSLAPALSYAVILSVIRFILQRYLVKPLAEFCMQVKEPVFVPIYDIDKSLPFRPKFLYERKDIQQFCQKSHRKIKDVQDYLMQRRKFKFIQQKYVKFVEALWRAIFYSGFSIVGYLALFTPTTAIWVTDTIHFWKDWPNHEISPMLLFYYHIQLGCYIHQLLWTEVSRSDAVEMIIHHFVTISLLIISFLTNFVRVGSVILLLHDLSDIFLEVAKVLNYSSKPLHRHWLKAAVDGIFAIFAVTFFVTRLVIYPGRVLYSMHTEGKATVGVEFWGAYIFPPLLWALQILHVFWFYLIAKMIFKLLFTNIEGDERSDADEDEDSPVIKEDAISTIDSKKKE